MKQIVWLFTYFLDMNCVLAYKILLSEQQIREVNKSKRIDQYLHQKRFIKNLFIPLTPMALKYTAMHVKKRGRPEDFYANFKPERLIFLRYLRN